MHIQLEGSNSEVIQNQLYFLFYFFKLQGHKTILACKNLVFLLILLHNRRWKEYFTRLVDLWEEAKEHRSGVRRQRLLHVLHKLLQVTGVSRIGDGCHPSLPFCPCAQRKGPVRGVNLWRLNVRRMNAVQKPPYVFTPHLTCTLPLHILPAHTLSVRMFVLLLQEISFIRRLLWSV